MNKAEAYNLLSYHSCRNKDVQNTRWINGFLGSLLQFEGVLHEENFIEIIECLKVLSDEFSKGKINQVLISDLTAIVYLGRCWTEKRENSELNYLFSNEQAEQIHEWVSIIEGTLFNLLQGNTYEAFYEYDKYMRDGCHIGKFNSPAYKCCKTNAI